MSHIQSPKGTFDILPGALAEEPWQSSQLWKQVEDLVHEQCRRACIHEIRMPIFESTELFQKSTGESSDIVQKEMYTFDDKGDRSMTLRPEGTPGALRALIDANAFQKQSVNRVYYLGPMFRYERPQQGRYRQFHQFGIEILGPRSPWLDAEAISLGWNILSALGLQETELLINTLASDATRRTYQSALKDFLMSQESSLSEDSKRRLHTNPLRILDSKDAADRAIITGAPKLSQMLDDDSKRFFDQVLELLERACIRYTIDDKLVRGLDYYCDTVFEFQIKTIGAQSAVGGGGRYGRMLSEMGGPSLEGVGFACGMERLLQATLQAGQFSKPSSNCHCFMIALGHGAATTLFALINEGRQQNLCLEGWPSQDPKKLKQALQYADKLGARYVAILGDEELANGQVKLRHMGTREEISLPLAGLIEYLKRGL